MSSKSSFSRQSNKHSKGGWDGATNRALDKKKREASITRGEGRGLGR